MQKVDGKDIAWLLRCKECSKTLKIKDVKETITGDFKMCDKHLEPVWNLFEHYFYQLMFSDEFL